MKHLFATAAIALGLATLAGNANAAPIFLTSTTPTWSNIVDGANTSLNTVNGAFTDVRWGNAATSAGNSGLGFDPAAPPATSITANVAFLLGTLRHYNNPITGAATSVNLNLASFISGAIPASQTFAYQFVIDETTNSGPISGCAYPSTTACADKISFINLDTTAAFAIGGINYTLALTGFSATAGGPVSSSFISQEGSTNSTNLYAVLTQATPAPEPASMALLGAGLFGLGMLRRRRQA